MSHPLLLNTLYQPNSLASKATPYGKFVKSFLEVESIPGDPAGAFLAVSDLPKGPTPWALVEQWQEVLALLLILHERGALQQYRHQLIEHVRALQASFLWDEFQPIAIYQALCARLLGQAAKELPIQQQASGAAPLEWGGHWSWGAIPHSRFHAELGMLWCLYGQLSEDGRYYKAAERLAEWQLNTLDHFYQPFVGLYSHEKDTSEAKLLTNNFLLFSAVSVFCARKDMAAVAEKQYDRLNAIAAANPTSFSSLSLVYDKWLSKYLGADESNPHALPSVFMDQELILAGCRSATSSAVSTLTGGGSGMGAMHRADVQVVNFGPQHLPLGDCQGFGIESLPTRLINSQVKASADTLAFNIQGTVRVAPRPKNAPPHATFRNGDHSGCWIDVKQQFENNQLSIETIFRGLYDMSSLAFAFFVKARSCTVEAIKTVKLRSFERYQGQIKNITLQGEHASLTIEAFQKQGEMQVIPLGGGDNFWGADFLVAYLLAPQQFNYSWLIK